MTTTDHTLGNDPTPPTALRQGDVLNCSRVPVVEDDGVVGWIATPGGVVVVSQTCDLVREDPPHVTVALLKHLDTSEARNARDGKQPRYVPMPRISPDSFADLDTVASLTKAYAAKLPVVEGIEDDTGARRFGQLVGRRFSRFAFPDDVTYWIEPLKRIAESKHDKPLSAEGRAFNQVSELRLESANGWSTPPLILRLSIILKEGTLPTFPDDLVPEMDDELRNLIRPGGVLQAPDFLAQRIEIEDDPVRRHHLWQALGQAWADKCKPLPNRLNKMSASERARVLAALEGGEIDFDVVGEDEYVLSSYNVSERIDLEHLSPPTPLARFLIRTKNSVRSRVPAGSEPENPSVRIRGRPRSFTILVLAAW